MKTFRKKLLASCLSLMMILSCGLVMGAASLATEPAFNIDTALASSVGFDTLDFSQAQYQGVTQSARRSSSDELQIETICKAYLAASRAYVRMPASYSNDAFVAAANKSSAEIAYRNSEYDYLAALYKTLGWEITSDNLVFDSFTADVDVSSATATVVESYTYYVTDGFGDESFRRREYTFDLAKGAKEWSIVGVRTNDPWELDEDFVYEALDVEAAISAQLEQMQKRTEAPIIEDEKASEAEPKASLNKWTYDTSAAVSYAASHYKDTSNSTFGFTTGNNCQNFSSQCVWAGLGGSGSSTTARPAVPTSRVGTGAFNVWCRNQSTTYYSEFYYNWAWDNVRGFAKLMQASSTSAEGPYGNAIYSNGIQNAEVGNVLSVDWGGAPSATTLDHAMFVTQVSGTAGSRTKADVKIAAHTSPTNSAYQTVSSYTSQSIGSFARSYITCGYYSVTQP